MKPIPTTNTSSFPTWPHPIQTQTAEKKDINTGFKWIPARTFKENNNNYLFDGETGAETNQGTDTEAPEENRVYLKVVEKA